MGSELVAVIAVEAGECIDGLARLFGPVKRGANVGETGLAAAGKPAEVEHDGLDPVIVDAGINGMHDIAQTIFARAVAGAGQKILERRCCRFLDNHAIQVEQQRAVPDRGTIRLR